MRTKATPAFQEQIIESAFAVREALHLQEILLDANSHDVLFLLENIFAAEDQILALLFITNYRGPSFFKLGEGAFE